MRQGSLIIANKRRVWGGARPARSRVSSWALATFDRYGSEAVVPSPDAEILNVPAAVFGLYAYGVVHPVGGVGIVAINGAGSEVGQLRCHVPAKQTTPA